MQWVRMLNDDNFDDDVVDDDDDDNDIGKDSYIREDSKVVESKKNLDH